MGHEVPATFELSVEGDPWSMVVRMTDPGDCSSGQPPPPPVGYIFDFRGEELWLCHGQGSRELPQKFEGAGFMRLKRAPPAAQVAGGSLEDRCRAYLREIVKALPLLPPQLPQQPSELEIAQEVRL